MAIKKKVKKMAVGGVTELEAYDYILDKPVMASARNLLDNEIDALERYKSKQILRHKNKKISDARLKDSIKFIDEEIAFKQAGVDSTSNPTYKDYLIFKVEEGFRNPIPTLQGTKQDIKTKKETDKYLKKKRAKGRNKTNMKKGGIVKSHRGDGIAKRGRTKGRII